MRLATFPPWYLVARLDTFLTPTHSLNFHALRLAETSPMASQLLPHVRGLDDGQPPGTAT
jgi:hypothetical protein